MNASAHECSFWRLRTTLFAYQKNTVMKKTGSTGTREHGSPKKR